MCCGNVFVGNSIGHIASFHGNMQIYGVSKLQSGKMFQNPDLILCAIQMSFFLVLRNNIANNKAKAIHLKTHNK